MSLRPKIKTDDNGNILDLPIDAETISTFKPYINICTLEDNGTKTAGTWLAKTDKISSLVDGQLFLYKITVAGATTTTLNITGSSGTALGAHTIYRYGTTKLTTQYAVGQYLILVYNTTNTCFRVVNDYDANSYAYVRQYQFGENAAGETNKYPILTRYNLTNKHGSYDTAYSRFYTETYVDTSNGYLYAPKLFSGNSEVALKADIPTKTSELTNNSNFVVDASYVHTDNNFTTAYKNAVDANSAKVSNVQADWNATTGLAVILNKPTFATVAISGSYNDLSNKPTIPTVDYPVTDVKVNGTSVVSNKIASITVPAAVTESTVAGWGFTKNDGTITGVKTTAGAHTTIDISSGKVSFNVPTKTSHLTNDSGYLTAITSTDVTNALGYTPGVGTVTSVNNITPTNGNVDIDTSNQKIKIFDTEHWKTSYLPFGPDEDVILKTGTGIKMTVTGDIDWDKAYYTNPEVTISIRDKDTLYVKSIPSKSIKNRSPKFESTGVTCPLTIYDEYIWTDGTNTYYSNGTNHYIFDSITLTWSSVTFTGLTNFNGKDIWTDGTNVYHGLGISYVLNKKDRSWSRKYWTLPSSLGSYLATGDNVWYQKLYVDGSLTSNIRYSDTGNGTTGNDYQLVLSKTTDEWTKESLGSLNPQTFDGLSIWHDVQDNVYMITNSGNHYVLDTSESRWVAKTWTGAPSPFYANYVWNDGVNTYYSYGTTQKILDVENSSWTTIDLGIVATVTWTDGNNIYALYNQTIYILKDADYYDIKAYDSAKFAGKTPDEFQAKLISATNIKTVNSNSLLGSGNISVGTVKSVRVQAGTGLASSTSTAQTTTLNTTISIASGYKLPTTAQWNSVLTTNDLHLGSNSDTPTSDSIVLGRDAEAYSYYSDDETDQYGFGNIVIGTEAKAVYNEDSINYSVVVGHQAQTKDSYSIAIGYQAHAYSSHSTNRATASIAIGDAASARYDRSIAIGYQTSGPNTAYYTRIGCGSYTSTGRALLLGNGSSAFTYMNASGSSWSSASDIRDKTDIKEIDNALDFINSLKPITYVMNNREDYLYKDEEGKPLLNNEGKQYYDIESHERGDKKHNRRFAGLSAQDTYQKMIEFYKDNNYADIVDINKYDNPDDEYLEQYSMQYERLVPFLIKAIQEQQVQINELKELIKDKKD